jgi:hypothetical protein
MSLLLALFTPAFAGDVFASVESETMLGMGGTWARLHPSEEGWWFFQGAGGDYWAEDLTPELGDYDDRARIQLTENATLQDVQIERCDDGGWLVAGSFTLDTFDDSAHAWRHDADFNLLGEIVIEEREDARAHNDMVVLCSDVATGVAYANSRGGGTSSFFDIDGTTLGERHEVDLQVMGGSMAIRPSDGRIVSADIQGPQADTIRISVFEADWTPVDTVNVPVPQDLAFWPQRLLPYGDGWILTYLTRAAAGGGTEGAVWLMAMDANFQVVDSIEVTSSEGGGNGRPWVVRRGDVLGVTYDRNVQPYIRLVNLQSDSVPDGDDLPDTGPRDDDTAADGAATGCGCGGGSSALLLAPLALLIRRRRG